MTHPYREKAIPDPTEAARVLLVEPTEWPFDKGSWRAHLETEYGWAIVYKGLFSWGWRFEDGGQRVPAWCEPALNAALRQEKLNRKLVEKAQRRLEDERARAPWRPTRDE